MESKFQTFSEKRDTMDQASGRFFFQPLDHFFHKNIEALATMSEQLYENGMPVCRMIRSHEGQLVVTDGGVQGVLMQAPETEPAGAVSEGTALASFQLFTTGIDPLAFPESPMYSRTAGMIQSIDTLMEKYRQIDSKSPQTAFEKLFYENFPYFSGCAENAIQLLTDLSIDIRGREPAVIAHYRYTGRSTQILENPALWVIDGPSRDVAEWLRLHAWNRGGKAFELEVDTFLTDYEAMYPLDPSHAVRTFARLLFPLSYIECCERYFWGPGDQDHQWFCEMIRLNEEKIADYEHLLKRLARRYAGIRVPEWITGEMTG
ncbi:spore coat protein YutH [Sporolactobacillus sp. Y61]|uniref:Spore coat protein YutH n=1 Tax=Sporolactobacillus sp. Y61 TaxID=3160863 RepID=A0AAU8IC24_9BACL